MHYLCIPLLKKTSVEYQLSNTMINSIDISILLILQYWNINYPIIITGGLKRVVNRSFYVQKITYDVHDSGVLRQLVIHKKSLIQVELIV